MDKSNEAIIRISKEDRILRTSSNHLKAIPEKKRKIHLPLRKAEVLLDGLKEQEEEIHGQIRERETLVEVENEKIKKSDEKMLSVKNQKEYVASQKEIDLAKKTIKKMEDQILELEEKKETIVSELTAAQSVFEQEKESASIAEKDVLDEEKLLKEKIDAYDKLKEELLPKIDPDLISTYEILTGRNIIPAAVEISQNNCMGCAMSIPIQMFNDIMRDSVGKCPHCGRILFYKAPEKTEEESGKKKKAKGKSKTAAKKKSKSAKSS